jgi:dipeptidyl aminopeptidase/acylaminoacyl peptidase
VIAFLTSISNYHDSPLRYEFRSFINIRSAISPSFSSDGSKVLFLTNITGTPQVWRVQVEGGWPEQLTYYDDRVTGIRCSPSDGRIAFSKDRGGDERDQIYMLNPDEGLITELAVEKDVIHGLGPWSPDGKFLSFRSNSRDRAFFDIYVTDTRSGEVRMIMEQDGMNNPEAWSNNGRFLLVKRQNTNLDSDLYLVDIESGDARCITVHSGEASYGDPAFAPDDRSIICLSNRDREFMAIVSINLESLDEEPISEGRWDLESLALTRDGDVAAYGVNEEGYSKLKILRLSDGRVEDVKGLPPGVVSEAKWSPDGELLAFTLSGSKFNSDIWVYRYRDGSLYRLTRSDRGGIPQNAFVEPELIHFETFDGLSIPAFLYLPESWRGEKPPVVMYIHGGPESQFRPSFNEVIQYFVNHGFAVFSPNVRGSTGYGKMYVHLDDGYRRMDAVEDLRYAHRWLSGCGRVDPKRIALLGGSYGGFMVLAALAEYPELWAAGVDLYGIANFQTFLMNTGPWRRRLRACEYGDPERDAQFLREISPIHKADRINAPLMVVHGENDPRVPRSEADQIVEVMRGKGIPFRYIIFDDEGHGITKLKNRITAFEAITEFLEEHLAP